jgi:riboflavin kinase / FMN adenylyltransferase
VWITSSIKAAKAPTIIALGNFDGVHLGHQRVMAEVLLGDDLRPCHQGSKRPPQTRISSLSAQSVSALHRSVMALGYDLELNQSLVSPVELPIGLTEGGVSGLSTGYPTVVTFSPHPQAYFSGTFRPLLTPMAEKAWQLAELGIRQLVMLPFDRAIAQLSPETFVAEILVKGLRAKRISVGSDFRFGKGRSGDAQGLQEIAAQYGVPVVQVPLKHEQGDRISSSRIRQALQTGELEIATHLLGRPYTLTGQVIYGNQLGRTIGFPTANLQIPVDKYLPRTGVYSVRVYGAAPEPLCGVMNIGNRPTVHSQSGQPLSVEVHILNWAADLYGQWLTVSLEGFVRPEQKFSSLDELKAQIAEDCRVAIATLSQKP